MISNWKLTLSCLLLTLPAAVRADDVVTDWNKTIRTIIQHEGLGMNHKANPGWSTRSMAMLNGAIYDVFQAVDRTHVPFLVPAQADPNTSLEAAVHQAAYEILLHSYQDPNNNVDEQALVQADYDDRMALITDPLAKSNGMALGSFIAQKYILNRSTDGADVSNPFPSIPGPGQWRPRPGQVAWGPDWGSVQSFAVPNLGPVDSIQQYIDELPPPPQPGQPGYREAFDQVKEYGDVNRYTTLDATETEQMDVGLFWGYDRPSMGPPPVLFLRNLDEIAAATGNTPQQNARMFAIASVAMADAAIAAWDAKYEYNFWRPIAAIQEAGNDGSAFDDGDPNTVGDVHWEPLGAPGGDPNSATDDFTPPFPAWTSGHATMGSAVFKALELFYETNDFDEIDGMDDGDMFTLTSQEFGADGLAGMSRQYKTFTMTQPLDVGIEAWDDSPEGENAISRIYLGIHWIFDQVDGTTLGNRIAGFVAGNYFQAIPEPSAMLLALMGMASVAARRRRTGNREL
jgi:hypothetical protein